jgi:hypothetical protein
VDAADSVSRFGYCSESERTTHEIHARNIGVDKNFGEVSVLSCKRCGRCWLHYLIEYEYLTASGRWFEGEIGPDVERSLQPNDAVAAFARMKWYYRSGSAFGGALRRTEGRLDPWLIPFSGK